jgi:hypothetical protein
MFEPELESDQWLDHLAVQLLMKKKMHDDLVFGG